MPIDFFEAEVRKFQDKFNEVFGDRVVCNLRTRQVAMLCICNLGILSRKIAKSNDRNLIQEFNKRKTKLTQFFKSAERSEQWSKSTNSARQKTDGYSKDSNQNGLQTNTQARATS